MVKGSVGWPEVAEPSTGWWWLRNPPRPSCPAESLSVCLSHYSGQCCSLSQPISSTGPTRARVQLPPEPCPWGCCVGSSQHPSTEPVTHSLSFFLSSASFSPLYVRWYVLHMYFLGERHSGGAAGGTPGWDTLLSRPPGPSHQLRCWTPPCRACLSWKCRRSAFFRSSTEAFCTTTTAAGRGEPGQARRAPGPRPPPAGPARTHGLAVRLAHPHRHGLPVLQGYLRADLLRRHLRESDTAMSAARP